MKDTARLRTGPDMPRQVMSGPGATSKLACNAELHADGRSGTHVSIELEGQAVAGRVCEALLCAVAPLVLLHRARQLLRLLSRRHKGRRVRQLWLIRECHSRAPWTRAHTR